MKNEEENKNFIEEKNFYATKQMVEMEINTRIEPVFGLSVIRVPGGWVYGAANGGLSFVPLPVEKEPITTIKRQYSDELRTTRSDGSWTESRYDENGNEIYLKNSDGYWEKKLFDKKGNEIYYEDSNGVWLKRQYNKEGNEIYYEDSIGRCSLD